MIKLISMSPVRILNEEGEKTAELRPEKIEMTDEKGNKKEITIDWREREEV